MPDAAKQPASRSACRLPALAGAVFCGLLAGSGLAWPTAASADDAEEMRLARQLVIVRCALCHGQDGQSLSPLYPKLAGQHAAYITKQIFNFKTGQRSGTVMTDVANTLLAADVRRVARYFSSLPISPQLPTDLGIVEFGRQLYLHGVPERSVSACVSCHGAGARGGAQMPRLASQHAEYLTRQLLAFRSNARGNDKGMHGSVYALGDFDIRALGEYLASLE